MEGSYSLVDETDRLPLSKAICEGNYDTVRQFAHRYSNLDVRLDGEGNTPLHYAAAALDQSMIELLVKEIGADPCIKNYCGKSTLDWWRSIVKIAIGIKRPTELKKVASAIIRDDSDKVESLLAFGPFLELPCIYQGVVQQPLHVASRSKSWRILNVLLDKPSAAEVLDNQDSNGQTPLMLVEKHLSNPAAVAALQKMRGIPKRATAESTNVMLNPNPRASLKPLFPKDYKYHLSSLNEKFSRGIRQDDFPEIQESLPTLYALTHLACLKALSCLWKPGEQLMYKLLQQFSGNASSHLCQQIEALRTYLEDLIQQDLIDELVEISDRFEYQGFTHIDSAMPTGGITFINPLLIYSVGEFWSIVAHELTHAALSSVDYAYAGVYPGNRGRWDFNSITQLAATGEYSDMRPEKVWIFDVLWLLESKDSSKQLKAMTLAQSRAVNNADTLVMSIACCLIDRTDLGQVNLRDEILTLSDNFPNPTTLEWICRWYTTRLSVPATTKVPEVGDAEGGLSVLVGYLGKQHITSRSTSEAPEAEKSSTSLAVKAGNNPASPGGSSVSTASTAASPPLLPQKAPLTQWMAALPETAAVGIDIQPSEPQSASDPECNPGTTGLLGRTQRAKSMT